MSLFLISFLLLLGASVLGYAISLVWNNKQLSETQSDKRKLDRAYSKIRIDYDNLVKHTNTFQSEKKKGKNQIEATKNKLREQKEIARKLEHEKEFIFGEYENFRTEAKDKIEASQKIFEAFDNLKEKTQKEKIKTDKWKIKYHETVQALQNAETEARKLKKEKEALIEQSKDSATSSSSLFEWESNYKELKLRYLALAREKKDLETSLNEVQGNFNKESTSKKTLAVIELEAKRLEKENQTLIKKLNVFIKSSKTKSKETVFDRIKIRSNLVDHNRIGKAFEHQKDNLKLLENLGASIEKRFNAVGIFQLRQIAAFNPKDEELFNHMLELPKGKIQASAWVSQARKLINQEEDPQVILSRIGSRKDHVDFGRIGEANSTKKDNLQVIKGIGPFIEKKLNAIGIFNFKQIAYFNEEDIEEINDIIELSTGHIKTDDWVSQAKRMK